MLLALFNDRPATADLRRGERGIRHLKASDRERERHRERTARERGCTTVVSSDTHIGPVIVGDSQKCEVASDLLLCKHRKLYPADQLSDNRERNRTPAHHADTLP
jgi:7-keto-8-aminopelargonate synthetase-like enzyme